MATTKSIIKVEIDSDVKERASQLLASIGLDQTAAIDMFFRHVIAEQRLPFQPITSPALDGQLIEALEMTPTKEYTLDVDENGTILINKDKHPELYDWAVNG